MKQLDSNSSKQNKIIFILSTFLFFIIIFYFTLNSIRINIPSDFIGHILQANYYMVSSTEDLSIREFIDRAPLPHSVTYPGWHLCLIPIYYLFRIPNFSVWDSLIMATAALTAIFNTLTVIAISVVFKKKVISKPLVLLAPLFAIIIVLIGPIFIPAVNTRYYLGQLYSGVWHNPTSQPLKLFIIVIFFLFSYIMENKERLQKEKSNGILRKISKLNSYLTIFSFLLILSSLFKPSLIIVFIPSLWLTFRNNIHKNKILLDVAFSFITAAAICAISGNLIWQKGTLDYIYLKPLFIFDLKDLYSNVFLILLIVYTFKNKAELKKVKKIKNVLFYIIEHLRKHDNIHHIH